MGNSASALPFAIGKQISTVNDGWALHEGSRKSDGSAVTVFVAKKPALRKTPVDRRSPNMMQLAPAVHHFSNCKKLRHPQILQVEATLDTDNPNEASLANSSQQASAVKASDAGDLIIVTEPCIPLEAWLQTSPPPELLAWGLESVIRALHFMHASANLAHGNVSPGSLFVTPAGDVKLWSFSLVTTAAPPDPNGVGGGGLQRHFLEWEGLVTPAPYRSPERQEGRWDAIVAAGIHIMDSYSIGVLIEHLFGGHIPAPLSKAVQRLLTTNLKMRPRLQPLLKCPVFDTPYQKLQLQLEQFAVQPVEIKIGFWQTLTPNMQAGLIPVNVTIHKLLPLIKSTIQTVCQTDSLRSQDMYRREVLSTIPPLFFISEHYLDEKQRQQIGGTIAVLFTMNDRAIRGALLQKITFLVQSLDKNLLNQSVFEPACSGFADSSATLRDYTLKASLELIPALTQPNLEKLSRYLVRLQSDPEASIRTHTVMYFSRLAPHLTEVSREKLLLPAFVRALRDPHVACRLAALKSFLKAKEFFSAKEIAGRVMPAVTPHLLDGARDVRKEAFVVVDDLMFFLRQESERMNSLPDETAGGGEPATGAPPTTTMAPTQPPAKPVAAAPVVAPASGSGSGSYLSGISSWMTSSTRPADAIAAPPAGPVKASIAPSPATAPPDMTLAGQNSAIPNDGWDDDDDDGDVDFDDIPARPVGMSPPMIAPKTDVTRNGLFAPAPVGVPQNNFFGSFEAPVGRPVPMGTTAGRGKLTVPAQSAVKLSVKPTGPIATKLSMEDDVADGWDDF